MSYRQHSTKTIQQARQFAEAGWTAHEIVGLFARDGLAVSYDTVRTWVDEDYAALRRVQNAGQKARRYRHRGRKLGHPQAHPLTRMRRIEALDEIGLSANAITKVMRLDFGDELTPEQVIYSLANKTLPRPYQRLLDIREGAAA